MAGRFTRDPKTGTGYMREFAYDRLVPAMTVIGSEHRMIHDGYSWHATHRVASLANLGTFDVLLNVPSGVFPHLNAMLFSVSDSPLDITSYEDVTTSDDGSSITTFNRNRNSGNGSGMILTHTPTVTDLGTLVHDRFVPDNGGVGSNEIGMISPNLGEEWILKEGSKYLVRLTNNSGGAINFTFEALWYEPGADI